MLGIVCALFRGQLRLPIECTSLIFPAVLWGGRSGGGHRLVRVLLFGAGLGHLPVSLFRPVMISISALLPLFLTHLPKAYREGPWQPCGWTRAKERDAQLFR